MCHKGVTHTANAYMYQQRRPAGPYCDPATGSVYYLDRASGQTYTVNQADGLFYLGPLVEVEPWEVRGG